jgi:hypothetical protein
MNLVAKAPADGYTLALAGIAPIAYYADLYRKLPYSPDDFAPVSRIEAALEDFAFDQLGQPIGQDVAGNSEASLELLEMLEAVQCSAQDEEGPFLAN